MFRSKTSNGILVDVCWHNKRAAENWISDHKDQINNIIETNNLDLLQHLINWKRILFEANQTLWECGELK